MLGVDGRGREVLTFIQEHVPPDLNCFSDEQLAEAAALIRRFHDATAGSRLAGDQEVVCHGDLSPCNAVFVEGVPRALIDFDAAAPGPRTLDLGYALWMWLNLGPNGPDCPRSGEPDAPGVRHLRARPSIGSRGHGRRERTNHHPPYPELP